MQVTIEDETSDGLARETWTFWFYDHAKALTLDAYSVSTRETKRHKWKVTRRYYRLNGRDSNVKEDDVPLDDALKGRALREFFRSVSVKLWSQIERERGY